MKPLAIILCAVLVTPSLGIADPADQTAIATTPPATETAHYSDDQVKSLVAPIALYPDELVSQVLVAATYPLEIVQAYQWLQQHPDLKGQDLTQAAQQQNWDPSIQALVVFPDVLKRMSQDITWTTSLGNAFLANQGQVMDSIQHLRINAEQAGKLKSTEQAKVETTQENGQPVVVIEPTDPGVVYVPEYDPVWIWGPAPILWPYPFWYYPPAPFGAFCLWGAAISLRVAFAGCCGWWGWGWRPRWHDHAVFVNNDFFHRYNFNLAHVRNVQGTTVWEHNAYHRLGVAYPTRALAQRFNSVGRFGGGPGAAHWEPRVSPAAHPPLTAHAVQSQLRESGVRVRGAAATERIGNRQITTYGYNRNRSAFGAIGPGNAARVHSNRGFSSLSGARMTGNYSRASRGSPAGGARGGSGVGGGHSGGPSGGSSGGGWGGGHSGGPSGGSSGGGWGGGHH